MTLVLLTACAAQDPERHTPPPDVPPSSSVEGAGEAGAQTAVAGFWIPKFAVEADEDPGEPNAGVQFEADLDSGSGWGTRARQRFRGEPTLGYGLWYATATSREQNTGTTADTHALIAELTLEVPIGGGAFKVTPGMALGFGGAWFDFAGGTYDDTGGAAGMARALCGIEIGENFAVDMSAGGLIWGYPSETIGSGAFVTLGAEVRF